MTGLELGVPPSTTRKEKGHPAMQLIVREIRQKVKTACLPRILKPPGITRERQEYLHTQIAEHVW